MAVHFKFKSAREFDKLDIEGPFITVSSLKDKIIEAKNLGKAADFDLVLTNNQTGEGERLLVLHFCCRWGLCSHIRNSHLKSFGSVLVFILRLRFQVLRLCLHLV